MDKFLTDNRKRLGRLEIIDVVEQSDIDRLSSLLDVGAPLNVHWNDWEYGSEVADLHALYEKGKRGQWNASDELDWDTPVTKDDWLGDPMASQLVQVLRIMGADEATQKAAFFDEMNYTVSQLLHGEQAALQICGQLTNECPTTDEKLYAAQQTADEARHTEVMARFLADKMGTIYPISPVNKVLLDELLSADGYTRKVLGMQTLFEGVAMAAFDSLVRTLTNPLFVDMIDRVKVDEARHAAFGVLSMRRLMPQLSQEEREDLEDWAFGILEALNANQQLHMLRTLGPKYGVDAERWVKKVVSLDEWPAFNSMMYMHTVMPNLKRLGLVTERTEGKYRELGIYSDVRELASA